jgi:hypothetical protein
MLDRLFLQHPRGVGESYFAHARVALSFGVAMIGGGLGCLMHAAVPALCTRTGSDTVRRLHARLTGRHDHAPADAHSYDI